MDMNEAIKRGSAQYQGSPKGSNSAYDDINPIKLWMESAISAATLEMLGHRPEGISVSGEDIERFRTDAPVAGLASELIGPTGWYGAAFKLGEVPRVAKLLDKVGDANTVLGSAKRSGVLFGGAVEAPRVIGSAITGGDTEETAGQAGFNTLFEAGFGGLGGYFRAAGKAVKKDLKLGAKVDLKQPPAVIAQDIQKAIDEGKIAEADIPYARNMIAAQVDAIQNEIPFEQMWADDRHWLHQMLTNEQGFAGRFVFDGDAMLSCEIEWS